MRAKAVCLCLILFLSYASAQSAEPVTKSPDTAPVTYVLKPLAPLTMSYPAGQTATAAITALVAISEKGEVEGVNVYRNDSVPPAFSDGMEAAVKQWKFQPVTQDGSAIPVLAKVTVNFNGGKREATPTLAPATAFPDRVRLSEGLMRNLLVSKVPPVYPPDALAKRLSGTVLVKAIVDKAGKVTNLELVSGDPAFVQAAIDSVRQWKYRPFLLVGHPIPVETQMQVNFTLVGR